MATTVDTNTILPTGETTPVPTTVDTPTPAPAPTTPIETPATTPTAVVPTTTETPPPPPPPATTTAPPTTSTFTAPTQEPTTQIITSVVSVPATDGNTLQPSTVVVTAVSTPSTTPSPTASRASSTASSSAGAIANKGSTNNDGLTAGGTIAIAVVIPVVVVALIGIAGLLWWRRRKQRKVDEDERRKEMEAYGFNPNNDPTLPVVGGMSTSDDQSGYRGWGAGAASNRKASTTLSSGAGNPAAYSPGSPNAHTDASGEPLVSGAVAGVGAAGVAGASHHSAHSHNTALESDSMGNPYAAGNMHSGKGVQRGPSNASSTYSIGGQSHHSGDAPIPVNGHDQYYTDYYQSGPYDNPYGQGNEAVIRENPARRNTRIERAPTFPNQGSSGVATNF